MTEGIITEAMIERAAGERARKIMQKTGICSECLCLRAPNSYPADRCNDYCSPKVEIITAALLEDASGLAAEVERLTGELAQFKSLEAHLPEGYAIGDDATVRTGGAKPRYRGLACYEWISASTEGA
jgi:hypothetical protein